jgi:hypothetical protein
MAGDNTPVRTQPADTVAAGDPWRLNEIVRQRRLRQQGQRTPAENLEEAFALIRFMSSFTGGARART